ncbi:MAG: MarR family transcriptional regulator [Acidimicrobiales bacterium]
MAPNPAQVKSSRTSVQTAESLRRVVGRLGRALRLAHINSSLSPSQREVLATIVRRGPLRLSELAAEEGLNPTMLSRILSHLETAKFVTRRADEVDARVVHLAATPAGLALHEEMRNERTDALFFALSKLSADQRRVVIEALPVLELLEDSLRNRNQ